MVLPLPLSSLPSGLGSSWVPPMAACAASGEKKDPVTQGAAVRCVCLGERAS